jgi:hypothetical protein
MKRLILLLIVAATAFGQGTPVSTNTWTPITTGGWGPGVDVVGYESVVYVGSRKLHCSLNFYKVVTTEPNSAMVCYSYPENRWHVLSKNENFISAHMAGAGHTVGQIAWMSDKDAILYESDSSGGNTAQSMLGHLNWFDVAGLTTRNKETVSRPWFDSATPYGSGSYNPTTGKWVVWWAYGSTYQTAVCDVAANTCATPATTGTAPPTAPTMSNINFIFNPENGLHYLYGGGQPDIFTFNDATLVWSKLTTTCTGAACVGGTLPPTRLAAGFAYSTVDHKFLMMGGCTGNSLCTTVLTDTWTFDPATLAWVQLSPSGTYPNATANPSFMRLTYDTDSNVFVYTTYSRGISVFALSTPLNYGRLNPTYAPTAGSLNRTTPSSSEGSWAMDPTITISGSNIYLGHHETGSKSSTGGCAFLHPYITSTPNSGTYTNLPAGSQATACNAIDPENSNNTDSSKLQLAVVNGTLWEAHERFNTSAGFSARVWAKSWNGSAWSGSYVGCITGACGTTSITQFPQALIGVGTVPHLGVIEWDNGFSSFTRSGWPYVLKHNGSAWEAVGGKLSIDQTDGSRALFMAMATDGNNPAACWSEEKNSDRRTLATPPQIQCKQYNGSTWVRWGTSSLNQGGASSYAYGVSMTYAGGKFYVAWVEKPTVNAVQKLYLCRWDGSSCTLLGGGALNINTTTGWAFHPSLTTDGTNVFLAWEEQANLGQKSLGYVKRWNGTTITQLGGAIAADTTNGSIEGITVAASSTVNPTVVFGELQYGSLRQTYVRQWNSVAWSSALGSSCPSSPSFVTTTGVLTESTLPARPALGASVSDPTFGNCVTRVSDATALSYDHAAPTYSKLQAFNSDGTKILLAGGFVIDASTNALLRTITGADDPRWSPIDPDVIYYTTSNQLKSVSASTGTVTTVHTFTGYSGFYQSEAFEEFSVNGRWAMFILTNGATSTWRIVSYDLLNDVVSSPMNYLQSGCGTAGPAWVAPDPTGTYAVIAWPGTTPSTRYCGVETYNISTLAYVGQVTLGYQHSDIALDSSGVAWVVQFTHAGTQPIDAPTITKARIPSGLTDYNLGDTTGFINLLNINYGVHGHISCRAVGQNFCVVSSHNENSTEDSNGQVAYEKELFKLFLDSTAATPHIQRVAHNRSAVPYVEANCGAYGGGVQEYWAQPHATSNRTGTLAIFGSTWGNNCNVEAYMVGLGDATPLGRGASIRAGMRGAIR